jgi:starvation-inducible DNA-binding protein
VIERVEQALPADELQAELRDLLCLAVVGDHVRWVATGDEAAELTEWLTDAVARWRALADRVASHLVTLGVAPDGRVRSLAEDIPLNWVPNGWTDGFAPPRREDSSPTVCAAWPDGPDIDGHRPPRPAP